MGDYPGDRIGGEFVYSKAQAVRIARGAHQSGLRANDHTKRGNNAGEIPVEAKSAALGRFDENGNWQSESDKAVVMSNPPASTAPRASTTSATDTTSSRPAAPTQSTTSSRTQAQTAGTTA